MEIFSADSSHPFAIGGTMPILLLLMAGNHAPASGYTGDLACSWRALVVVSEVGLLDGGSHKSNHRFETHDISLCHFPNIFCTSTLARSLAAHWPHTTKPTTRYTPLYSLAFYRIFTLSAYASSAIIIIIFISIQHTRSPIGI